MREIPNIEAKLDYLIESVKLLSDLIFELKEGGRSETTSKPKTSKKH